MNKQEFLSRLRNELSALSEQELEERLNFYREMIDDRIEDGLTEEDAVEAVGSVDEITAQILSESSPKKQKKEKKPKKSLSATAITLIIVGAPLWLPLLIAAFVIVIALYAVIWSVIISIWAAFGAFVGGAVGGVFTGIIFICTGNALSGIALIGAGFALAGLAIFSFFGCLAATKGSVRLTKKTALLIKKIFTKREAA